MLATQAIPDSQALKINSEQVEQVSRDFRRDKSHQTPPNSATYRHFPPLQNNSRTHNVPLRAFQEWCIHPFGRVVRAFKN